MQNEKDANVKIESCLSDVLGNSGSERIFIRLIFCDGFEEPDADVERHRASDDQDLLLGRVGRQRADLLDVDVDVEIRQGIKDALNQDGHILLTKLIESGWALQSSVGNKIFNLGTTNANRIDLALKMRSCDIISPCSLKIVADC